MSRSPFVRQIPEPGNLWIRFAPRNWPNPRGAWIDLATRTLGAVSESEVATLPDLGSEPLDDVLYLPPVSDALARSRDEVAEARAKQGTPVWVQVLATSPARSREAEGVELICDLTSLIVSEGPEGLSVPRGQGAMFPLLPGISDTEEVWQIAADRLLSAGAAWAFLVAPRLTPADRRRLAGEDDERFEAIFHRDAPAETLERAAARVFARAGLEVRPSRPLPRPPISLRENRRLAGVLAEFADLWARLDRSAEVGASLFRAARWVDATRIDVAALAREGNLAVLSDLGGTAIEVLSEAVLSAVPDRLRDLSREYLGQSRH